MSPGLREGLRTALAAACGWSAFLPLGIKYLALLGCAATAGLVLARTPGRAGLLHDPGLRAAGALWLLTLASVLWSSATPDAIVTQVWMYSLPLLVPAIAAACPPALGQQVLRQFALAAALVGGATTLAYIGWLPGGALWHSSVEALGMQRIVNSLLLALGASLSLLQALRVADAATAPTQWQRLAWFGAAALALLGLALQDRRTGMVLLPALLAVLVLARQRSAWRSLALLLLVAAASAAALQFSTSVRARFDEGLGELRAYQPSDAVATSWGMRLRMAERTLDMVRERPLLGHGVASWRSEWQQRVQPDTPIAQQTTPHSEYLLVAAQLGVAGLLLLGWLLATHLLRAWRAGPAGHAALLVWTAIAVTGLFNVVLRDAKLALPLLLLAAMAAAASRAETR